MRESQLLLVDDDPGILIGIGKSLEVRGYNVATADSGEQAISLLNKHHFDLVITDLIMSGMDGIQVLKTAKEIDPETMVIMLTGYGSLSSSIAALRQDADDYLLKPSDPDEIDFRVKRCLEKQADRRKLKLYENILPVCCVCGKIRDDHGKEHGSGDWLSIEGYLWKRAGVAPSSTYCPKCFDECCCEIEHG